MIKVLKFRPHHLVCLPGYKGANYDQSSKNSWDMLSKEIKENPNLKIKIVNGPDSLCLNCPKKGANCAEASVEKIDMAVKKILKLRLGGVYVYKEINDKLKGLLNPKKHATLCGDCFWRTLGFCKDTFKKQLKKSIKK